MPRVERKGGDTNEALRLLPSVEELSTRLRAIPELGGAGKGGLLTLARRLVAALRERVLRDGMGPAEVRRSLGEAELAAAARRAAPGVAAPYHARVLNATGVVLHTGIGRAPLPERAVAALVGAAGACRVEVDAVTGERGRREDAVAGMLQALTGAEAALAVNNNAGACVLALQSLARGKEVVVSRGELVEIGGGFRMPDVMARAGCRLVEVGTTNRTYLRDYEAAISENTAMLLKVHPSNFRLEGFTHAPSLAELVGLGRARGVLVMEDLGSGLLFDGPIAGLEHEPRVSASVASGADLVTFSGDKLMGTVQAGIVLGGAASVARLRSDPLYRALRLDKLSLAALEATLAVYRDGDPLAEIPVLARLSCSPAVVKDRAERLRRAVAGRLAAEQTGRLSVAESESFAGSGANPARPIPSFALAVETEAPDRLAEAARLSSPALFLRVHLGRVLLDARTLGDDEIDLAASLLVAALTGQNHHHT